MNVENDIGIFSTANSCRGRNEQVQLERRYFFYGLSVSSTFKVLAFRVKKYSFQKCGANDSGA